MTHKETVIHAMYLHMMLVEYPYTISTADLIAFMARFPELESLDSGQINTVGRNNDELELYYPDLIAVYQGSGEWSAHNKEI